MRPRRIPRPKTSTPPTKAWLCTGAECGVSRMHPLRCTRLGRLVCHPFTADQLTRAFYPALPPPQDERAVRVQSIAAISGVSVIQLRGGPRDATPLGVRNRALGPERHHSRRERIPLALTDPSPFASTVKREQRMNCSGSGENAPPKASANTRVIDEHTLDNFNAPVVA